MKKILFILTLSFSLSSFAKIQELRSYQDLDLNSLKGALVIFDIDNTLLRQDSMVGTHQWGDYMRDKAIEEQGLNKEQASAYQHRIFAELQPYLKVVPVEKRVIGLLNYLEAQKIPHFALTARPGKIKDLTVQQLKAVQHSFAASFPAQKDPRKLTEYLKEGVIFSGETPKGELLKMIIDNSVVKPQKIIFIDDKLYNLESVEKSLAGTGVALTSYRYGAADAFVKGFNPDLANLIYSFFKEAKYVPTDKEALEIYGDVRSVMQQRFEFYLDDQGPLAKGSIYDCEQSDKQIFKKYIEFTYQCEFIFDGEDSVVDFKLNYTPSSKAIVF